MSKKSDHAEAILKHGFKLKRIFPNVNLGPVDFYNALLRIEQRARGLAERECNEKLPDGYVERAEASIKQDLFALIGHDVPVFLNGDPRGYALKIDAKIVCEYKLDIFTDMGGDGVLAPEF